MSNPKIHFDPFMSDGHRPLDDEPEQGYCGTYLNSDGLNVTGNRKEVTCKRCIKLFPRADKEIKDFIDFSIL